MSQKIPVAAQFLEMHRLLLLLAVCSAAIAEPPPIRLLPADGLYSLPLEQAGQLFHQCSRGAPDPGAGLWSPLRSEIAALEIALPPYLAERKAAMQPTPPEKVEYGRQYVGFTRKGAHLIYGNFFPLSLWSMPPSASRGLPDPASWPVIICDGGPTLWGIVYNPATNSFEEPQFNGPL